VADLDTAVVLIMPAGWRHGVGHLRPCHNQSEHVTSKGAQARRKKRSNSYLANILAGESAVFSDSRIRRAGDAALGKPSAVSLQGLSHSGKGEWKWSK
jgi:hypothetical protein